MTAGLLESTTSPRVPEPQGRHRSHRAPEGLLAWSALGLAALLWTVSLPLVDLEGMGAWGLLQALPAAWFASLGILVVGTAAALTAAHPSRALMAAHLAGLVTVLYGTLPLVSPTARYDWSYKHIGVARYVIENGGVDPEIDIYHRWPGFFAWVATLSEVSGVEVAQLARGAEPFFAAVNLVLVVAVARSLTARPTVPYLAGAVFTVSNWVGQGYFAPQALAFSLSLGVTLLLLTHRPTHLGPLGRWAARLLRVVLLGRDEAAPTSRPKVPRPTAASVLAVVVLFGAVVVSHQLTPFLVLIGLVLATAVGCLRPRWLVAVLAVVAVAYLLPNLSYVTGSQGGLLSSFNPLANAALTYSYEPVLPEKQLRNLLTPALMLLVMVGGMACVLLLARTRQRDALLLGALLGGPVLLLAVQNYGGEARLRVFLFMLPWAAIAIAWTWQRVLLVPGRVRPVVATTLLLGVLTALFLPAFYGDEDITYVDPDEVAASEWVYSQPVTDAVLVVGTPSFPVRPTAGYDALGRPSGDQTPALSREELDLSTGPADLSRQVLDVVHEYAPSGYVVFSTNQERYARTYGLFEGDLGQVENAVVSSGEFRLVHRTDDARVYATVDPAPDGSSR